MATFLKGPIFPMVAVGAILLASVLLDESVKAER